MISKFTDIEKMNMRSLLKILSQTEEDKNKIIKILTNSSGDENASGSKLQSTKRPYSK